MEVTNCRVEKVLKKERMICDDRGKIEELE